MTDGFCGLASCAMASGRDKVSRQRAIMAGVCIFSIYLEWGFELKICLERNRKERSEIPRVKFPYPAASRDVRSGDSFDSNLDYREKSRP